MGPDQSSPVSLKLSAVGDVSLHHEYSRYLEDGGGSFLDRLAGVLPPGVPVLANLESPLTRLPGAFPGKCSLRADPSWASILARAGVRAVSLANNHAMDSGSEGLLETMNALDAAGIAHTGAGRNLEEARRPAVIEVGSRKVGILGYSTVPVRAPVWASRSAPGVAAVLSPDPAEDVERLRTRVDVLLVSLHWGREWHSLPGPDQRKLARRFLAAGADAVLGHHPHVLQGMERVEGKPVHYSLGNFLFSPTVWTGVGVLGETFTEHMRLSPEEKRGVVLTLEVRLTDPGRPAEIGITRTGTRLGEDHLPRVEPSVAAALDSRDRALQSLYRIRWQLESTRRGLAARLRPWIAGGVTPRRLLRVRPRHLYRAAQSLFR